MRTVCVLLLHQKLDKTQTATKKLQKVDILTICMSTERVRTIAK